MRAAPLLAEIEALLLTVLPKNRVHVGHVPDTLPMDATYNVLPYVFLFSGLGADLPLERDLSHQADPLVRDLSPQVNCVGPTSHHALMLADDIYAALINQRVGNHWLKPDADAMRTQTALPDEQVSPTRFFMPLSWRLTTT